MNDAVNPDVSDETLAQEFARLVAEYHGASEDDPTRPEAWNLLADFAVENGPAISAALAAQGHEPVADLEEAIRLAEVGEYLYNACAYSYGDGYTEPREYGIEWQWQQSKPDEFGQGQLLAASTRWHQEQSSDGFVTEASKLRSALTAPARPVGVPEGWRLVPVEATSEMMQAGEARRNHKSVFDLNDAFHVWKDMVRAAPQPPAEGGWQDMSTAPRDGTRVLVYIPDFKRVTEAWYCAETGLWPHDEAYTDEGEPCNVGLPSHWMPLPPTPANGGDKNG